MTAPTKALYLYVTAMLYFLLLALFLSAPPVTGLFSEEVWLRFCDVLNEIILFSSVMTASSAN